MPSHPVCSCLPAWHRHAPSQPHLPTSGTPLSQPEPCPPGVPPEHACSLGHAQRSGTRERWLRLETPRGHFFLAVWSETAGRQQGGDTGTQVRLFLHLYGLLGKGGPPGRVSVPLV